jgi:hypothetical protein
MDATGVERWVPSRGHLPRLVILSVFLVGFFGFVLLNLARIHGWANLLLALEFVYSPGGTPPIAVYTLLLLPAVTFLTIRRFDTRKIGLGHAGVILVAPYGARTLAWSDLRPNEYVPSGSWGFMRSLTPDGKGSRSFWLTKEQAAAILSDSRAPRDLFPPEYWTWADLPQPQKGKLV